MYAHKQLWVKGRLKIPKRSSHQMYRGPDVEAQIMPRHINIIDNIDRDQVGLPPVSDGESLYVREFLPTPP